MIDRRNIGAELRRAIAGGLHYLGPLRLMETFARTGELRFPPGGMWPSWSRVQSPRFAILCYHRIGTGGVPFYSELPATIFEAQMRFLKKHYRVISLSQMLCELTEPVSCEPTVVVTFDDGYRDLFPVAYPVLLKYGIPATVYLTVGAIESGEIAWYDRVFAALQVAPGSMFEWAMDVPRQLALGSKSERIDAAVQIITWMRTLPDSVRREQCAILEKRVQIPKTEIMGRMLTWEQVRIMQKTGISFGAHTMNHPAVSRLSTAELNSELLDSKRIIEERIQDSAQDFAYPFGKPADMSSAAENVLSAGSYRSAVTTEQGLNVPGVNPYRLCRVSIGEEGSLAMFAFQLNRLFLQGDYAHPSVVGPGKSSLGRMIESPAKAAHQD
jgi:peptidoglycan/xylan/chitin deacetylase (PgdA/CDA1 family)